MNGRRGRFKRGDLYKMHTYRDAIANARSVWILYPGHETCFFDLHAGPRESLDSMSQPIEVVGAIALTPEATEDTCLTQVLRQLVQMP